jgi:putative pyoverdin transport system ATP-binding/permease protein
MKTLLKIFIQEAPQEMIMVLFVSGMSGLLGGLLIPFVLETARYITRGFWSAGYLLGLVIVTILLLATKWFSQQWAAQLSEKSLERLSLRLYNQLRQMELRELEQYHHADILLATVQVQDLTNALMKTINVCQLFLSLIASWLYIVWLSPLGGFLVLIGHVISLLAYKVFQSLTHHAMQIETSKQRDLFRTFQHIFDGFKELKLDWQKSAELFEHDLIPLIEENRAIRTKTAFYFSEYHLFTDICGYAVMGSIALLLAAVGFQEAIAAIFAMIMYQGKMILVLLAQFPDIIKGQQALTRFRELIPAERTGKPLKETLYRPSQERMIGFQSLRLQDIQFAYPPSPGGAGFSVGPLNVTLQAGDVVFLTGGNGSGKTTLLHLVTGLYRPVSGSFALNGRLVKMTDYRHLFSGVLSNVHLFDRLYGLEQIDAQRLQQLLAQMDLAQRVQYVDGRFTTLKLSTGQRKRLALVVALLEDKPIYVFDEWAADQSPDFRHYFYHVLLPALKAQQKTLIVISHDDRYFAMADHLIKMEYGHIVHEQRRGGATGA